MPDRVGAYELIWAYGPSRPVKVNYIYIYITVTWPHGSEYELLSTPAGYMKGKTGRYMVLLLMPDRGIAYELIWVYGPSQFVWANYTYIHITVI